METFDGTVLELYEYVKSMRSEYTIDNKPMSKVSF